MNFIPAELIKNEKLEDIRCVPSSFQSLQLIRKHRLQLTDLEESPELNVAIDGADEVDYALTCIKGSAVPDVEFFFPKVSYQLVWNRIQQTTNASFIGFSTGGGGCLTQEKIVAASAKRFVIIADYSKQSASLGEKWKRGIPVEVLPMAYAPVTKKIEAILGAEPVLRQAVAKAVSTGESPIDPH